MNRFAVQHIVDSSYCFPVDLHEITLRLRTAKNDVKEVWVIYESKYVIGETQKKALMEKKYTGGLYDYYSVTLNLEDTRLAYVFYIDDGEECYYFSEDGLTKTYDFTIGYYNFFQYPYINEADLMRKVDWTEHAVFYQIFVDRFQIGNNKSDKSYVNCKWGDVPTPKTFAGGDLKGIIEKIEYLKNLGINTIYLTPIFKSKSNHKYDISDYFNIDEHFGSNEDFAELVQVAHSNGIKIVLDAVFNHCSDRMMQFQDVLEKGKNSKYFDWFIIHGDAVNQKRDNYEMFATCNYMPKFNTSNEEVQKYLLEIGRYYIEQYDIDGWRLDVSDEISHDFWRRFRKAIKSCKADCVIIGENWHDASNYLRGDQYDSIMNYAFTKACLDYFAKQTISAAELAGKLNDILARNNDIVNGMMLNLLDSHDTHRFFSEVGENPEKMYAALALLYMFPGMPCIFYGTEFLTSGGYDPDCRRCMDWDGFEKGKYDKTVQKIKKLSELRRSYPLATAKTKIYSENDIFVMKRSIDQKELSLFINLSDHDGVVENHCVKSMSHVIVTK